MQKSLLILLFLFLSELAIGQPAEVMALRSKESRLKRDTSEVLWHYELSKAYRMINPDSSIYAAQRGVSLSKKLRFRKGEGLCYSALTVGHAIKGMFNEAVKDCARAIEINKVVDPKQLAMNYSHMGLILQNQGHLNQAIHYQNLSLKMAARFNDSISLSRAHNNIGTAYIAKGEFLRANDHFYKLLRIAEQLKDTMGISTASGNISKIFIEQKDYKRALEYANKALLLHQKSNNAVLTVIAYNGIGTIYTKLGDQRKAISYYEKAVKLAKETGAKGPIGSCFTNLGLAHLALARHDKALDYLYQAEAIEKAVNNSTGLSLVYIGLSKAYEKTGKPDLQRKYALMALKLAQQENLKPELRDAAENLYSYYKSRGDASQSLYYLELYTKYKDSLFNADNIKQLKVAEYKYARESQQKEIQLLKNKNELKEKENNLQRTYLYGSFALCLAAIGFIIYYLRQIRVKNKLYESVRQKSERIEEQSKKLEELNLIKNKVISVMSHDMRTPIASLEMILNMEAELSDPDIFRSMMKELKPTVSSLSLLLENILGWAKSQMQSSHETKIQPIHVCSTVDEIITLYTPISSQKSVALINEVAPEVWVGANQSYLTLVLRNLVSNAIKFSPPAGPINISATSSKEHVSIIVSDKGLGMTEQELDKLFNVNNLYTSKGTKNEKGTGLGLIFVKESVELCGGSLTIKSVKNEGSQFICSFPVAIPEQSFIVSNELEA
ncbi:MAG TPA: tetratricopeptide repeat-containing sensor histidine kinase [Pedobacter sp.]